MNARTIFAIVVALAAVVAAGAAAWYALYSRPPAFCELSGRPIHANMLTVVRVDGERLHACCARRALILAAQTAQQVEILQVTDHRSGRSLPAVKAYYVEGSQMEVCSLPRSRVDGSRTPYTRLFDRCSPSLLAFTHEEEAGDFISRQGGRLKRLNQLMAGAASPVPSEEEGRND
jgi:hypothetical protein